MGDGKTLRQIAETAGEEGGDCPWQGARMEGPELREVSRNREKRCQVSPTSLIALQASSRFALLLKKEEQS